MLEQHQSYCNYSWKWKKGKKTKPKETQNFIDCVFSWCYFKLCLFGEAASPKFGVQCQLWNVDSVEVGDVFLTPEHVLLQLNMGFLKQDMFLLKFTRLIKFFFTCWLSFLYEHLGKDSLGYSPDWTEIGMTGEQRH